MPPQSPSNGAPLAQERALSLITEALDLLDAHGGSAQAAAHLDMAAQTLREDLASKDRPEPDG